MNDDHESLVEQATQGSQPAIDALLARHLSGLRAFVRLKAGPVVRAKESCSDIVQSVCREVLGAMGKFVYQGEPQFRNWLCKQALHKIINKNDHYRARKRDAAREVPQAFESGDGADLAACYQTLCTPSRVAGARESIDALERAFDSLPEQYREAITLHRVVGLSYAEIAQAMGKSEGAVRNLVYRGVARLTMLLEE